MRVVLFALAAMYWLTVGGGCGGGTSTPNVEVGPCNPDSAVLVYSEAPDGKLTFYREIEGGTGRQFRLPPGSYKFVSPTPLVVP